MAIYTTAHIEAMLVVGTNSIIISKHMSKISYDTNTRLYAYTCIYLGVSMRRESRGKEMTGHDLTLSLACERARLFIVVIIIL